MARTQAIWNVRSRIQAVCVLMYVHSQKAVRPGEFPAYWRRSCRCLLENLPLCERFNTVGASTHLVACDEGQDNVAGHWAALYDRSSWLSRAQFRVIVVEGGNVQR